MLERTRTAPVSRSFLELLTLDSPVVLLISIDQLKRREFLEAIAQARPK